MIKFKKSIFMFLSIILISATSMISFADDVNVTWQDDLDESKKGNLTVQQYDVNDLYFASQGIGSSTQNRITNERMWEDESIIFDSERVKNASYYIDAKTGKKEKGVDLEILFYTDSDYFAEDAKQSLKAWGYFVPSKTGYYKFKMESDDGSYLSIFKNSTKLNDLQGKEEVLINDMSVSGYNGNISKIVKLEAKKPYPILIKYFNWGGDGFLRLQTTYSEDGTWSSNANYAPINQNDLYPSKKTDFFINYGDTQYLKNMQETANDRLSRLEGQTSLDIDKLKELLEESEKMVLEYYNYTQAKMNKLYEEMRLAIIELENTAVVVEAPYPDDFLISANGKLMVQKYVASDINAAYEGGGNNAYNNNKAIWTNESYIFNPSRKDGMPKLYTAEIKRKQLNAAVEEVFFYDGGGDYGLDAKEIREGWGYFVPDETGYYQFESLYDDGIRAYLYTEKVKNDLKYTVDEATQLASHYAIGVFSRASSRIRLEAGKPYPIYINHFNWHGPNKLALRYRYSTSSSVTGSYKDVPASWFYASDKDDFFKVHGDINPVKTKVSMLNDALSNLPTNTSNDDREKFNILIDRAETMINKYYNYSDSEIESFVAEIDSLLANINYNVKIRRYIEDEKEYIEIIEDFDSNSLDLEILSPNSFYDSASVDDGMLKVDASSKLKITESFAGYDYVEMTIDQIYNGKNYASLGVPNGNSYIEVAYLEIKKDKKDKDKDKAKSKMDMFKEIKFNAKNNINVTTKLIARKKEDGKYKITVNVYERGNVTEAGLLVSDDSSSVSNWENNYNVNNLYISTFEAKKKENDISYVDNLKIVAYKALAPFEVDIKNFNAETSGSFIKLTWDKPSEEFDSYVIKELIDGVVVNDYDDINSAATEKSISLIGVKNYSDRTFEIYAKKNGRFSSVKNTTWHGGVSFLSITNFKASTNGSNILLSWDALDSNLIDKYVIKEITAGHEATISSNVNKNDKTYTLPIINSLSNRTFTIEAYRGTENNKSAEARWENDLSTVKINNFKVIINGGNLVLTWDKVTGDFDGFEITEVISGSSDIIASHTAGKNDVTKSIALGNTLGDRSFTIVAVKGILKSSPVTETWNDAFADLAITGFTAKANGDKIVLTWNSVSGEFDDLVVTQLGSLEAPKTLTASEVNESTVEFDLGDSTAARDFTIHAVLDGRNSNKAKLTWSVSDNSMTVNQISGHTGKKLGVLVFEGLVSDPSVSKSIPYAGYKVEGSGVDELVVKFGTDAKTTNVMYLKSPLPVTNEASWKAEALESINRYASNREIDFYIDSYYATKYSTGDSTADAINTNKDLLVDFKRILETAGLTDVRDSKLEEYKDKILAGNPFANLAALQDLIEEINGPIDTTNKDKDDDDEYIDLVDNTKLTSHDSEFALATEIKIGENPIYNPRFEFELQGNEYLTYENPKVSLYNELNKRVSSKAIIEYDATSYKYSIEIIPTGDEGSVMTKGTYYVNLDTKTEVNVEKHSLDYILGNNKDTASKAKIGNDNWKFAYFINQITINDLKITDGLSSIMTIKYTISEDSTDVKSIKSEKIHFEIENAAILPGGF